MNFTISKAIGTAIDPACNHLHVVLISQSIQAIIRPELTSNHQADTWYSYNLWIVFKVDAELLSILAIVGAASQLNWATAFISLAISWLCVTQILSTFISCTRSDFFHIAEAARLMCQLRKEVCKAK